MPSEIILEILQWLCPPVSGSGTWTDNPSNWTKHHRDLCNAALVSRAWAGTAPRALFSRLHLVWRGGRAARFLRTLAENPSLHVLVRDLVVSFSTHQEWEDAYMASDAYAEAFDEAERRWPVIGSNEASREYMDECMYKASIATGDRKWLRRNTEGRQEGSDAFWSLIAKFPVNPWASLRLQTFTDTLTQSPESSKSDR